MENVQDTEKSTDNLLLVDSREPKQIFDKLDKKGVKYEKRLLPVGDFVYNNFVFERKEIGDFACSIMNGRIFEQAENMKENYENCFVLVSGRLVSLYFRNPHFNQQVFFGAVAALLTKHKVIVIRVENDAELINQMLKICEKSTEPYSGFVKRISVNEADIYLGMLSCIPKVGHKKAERILQKYSFKEIVNLSVEQLMLVDGIGEKIAKEIKKYL